MDFEGLFQAALVDQGKGVASFEPRGGGVTGVKGRLRVDFPLSGFDKTEGLRKKRERGHSTVSKEKDSTSNKTSYISLRKYLRLIKM